MEEKKNILTYQGLRKYEDELHDLKVVKRQEVAQKIKEAREQGDLPRTRNMMQQRTNSAISKQGLKSWKRS